MAGCVDVEKLDAALEDSKFVDMLEVHGDGISKEVESLRSRFNAELTGETILK